MGILLVLIIFFVVIPLTISYFKGDLVVDAETLKKRTKWSGEYDEYMKSDDWTERRRIYFLTHEEKCTACESFDDIDLHHLTYDRLGDEKDEDLFTLCKICHAQYHAVYENTSMSTSRDFIAAKQAAKKGKEIFLKNHDLITEWVNNKIMEYSEEALQLSKIMKDPNYDLLPYKVKQDVALGAHALRKMLNEIPFFIVRSIIEIENTDSDEDKLKATPFSLKYRWVAEEIKSILPENKDSYTELQKLKGVLMLDEFSLMMKNSGHWRDAEGWHSSWF